MSRFLLDTNILSEPLKMYPNQTVMEMLQRHEQDLAIASVTWHEILGISKKKIIQCHSERSEESPKYFTQLDILFSGSPLFGCYRLPVSRKRQKIEQYLTEVVQPNFPILPYDTASAHWHAHAML